MRNSMLLTVIWATLVLLAGLGLAAMAHDALAAMYVPR